MDAIRKQLDVLMGANRNGDVTEVDRKYYDRDVCRLFLVGLCPHELFQLTKMDMGPCPKVHSFQLRKEYQEAKAKGQDNYDRELEDIIDRLIVECDRKITRALKRLSEEDAKAAIAISVSEVTQTPEILELSKQIKEKLKEADEYELEGKGDMKIRALEMVEIYRAQRADKQSMLLLDAFNKDRASLPQPLPNPPPLAPLPVANPDARTQELINEKLKKAEELGEQGMLDEAQKALEEAEALKKLSMHLPPRQEPVTDSSKYTAADVRVTDQKLRVCDICGAFLSVYDSDRRLADHFGGKLHLGYMQIREKLADLLGPVLMTGPDLLHQLHFILDSDPLIDEVGFVHPSQFAVISGSSMSMESDDATNMAFWSRDHKLGISTNVMHTLYIAAKRAFMFSVEQYRKLADLHAKNLGLDSDNIAYYSSSLASVESDVVKHSRVLLLLSCDFGTAWNCRKEVAVKKHEISLYLDELRFSSLVLSYSPKSERAWSHRRWVIKMIASKCTDLQMVLKNESELAERITKKSKMNYRAWNHRCWLVSYMPENQVIDELVKYREWAGLHVADNSCFNYRTRLMTRTLEDSWHKQDLKTSPEHTAEVSELWKEELAWCEILIKRYIGREALWLYRRFLSLCWIKHFAARMGGTHIDLFMDNELQLFHSCTSIPDNVFEDYQSQALFAATYMMWLIKQMDEPRGAEAGEKVGEELEEVLNKVCPNKVFLWDLVKTKNGTLIGE